MRNRHKSTGSPVHILVISPYFLPTVGGSQRYIEELYAHLIKTRTHLHVSIIAYNTEHVFAKETYRGLTIYRVPCIELIKGQFALPHVFPLIATIHTISKKHVDFVHTHIRFFDATWWAWIVAKILGAKSIFTEQVASHPVHDNPWVQKTASFIDMTIASWSIAHYDLITTTNEAAKQFLIHDLHITNPINVSYGGIDTRFFSPAKKKNRSIPHLTASIPKKDTVITFASRLIWSKGITYFIQSLRTMKRFPSHTHVIIAGEGILTDWVQTIIRTTSLRNHVHFVGSLNYQEMRQLLRETDIFIHPSHHNEGFPNVLLEAMSTRCFVIATDNAGTKEMLTSGKNGLLIRQKSPAAIETALRWAITHKKQRTAMAKQARSDVKTNFDWRKSTESFSTFVQQFCILQTAMLATFLKSSFS